ncbi:MAG: hypothetical protein DI547_16140 [Sphingobium sp.]|nr:MAG: hypothetical protein DI547_16140 [Sphingobium sp.]
MSTSTVRQLEIFAQTVASGSIAECARALDIATGEVESALDALQQRLGLQLLVVERTGVRLTPAGLKTIDAMAQLSGIAPEPETEEETQAGVMAPPVDDVIESVQVEAPETEPEAGSEDDTPRAITESAAPEAEPTPAIADEPLAGPVETAGASSNPESGEETVEDDAADDILLLEEEAPAIASEPVQPAPPAFSIVEKIPLTRLHPPEEHPEAEEPLELELSMLADAVEAPAYERMEAAVPLRSLAARVAFTAPAPIHAQHPTVVSLYTSVPLPVPANDPEAPASSEPLVLDQPAPEVEPEAGTRQPHARVMPDWAIAADPEPDEAAQAVPDIPPPVIDLSAAQQQQVILAAHPAVFAHFKDALSAFEQANPDVSITLELDAFTAMRAEPLLATGKVDIVYYYALGERERFESRYVWSERLSIFIGADHPLARREAVTVDDLRQARPILLGSRNGMRPVLDNALQRAGIDLWHPAMETDNLFNIMTAVRDGVGFFAAFGSMARDFGKMDGIRRLPFVDHLPNIEVRQAVREGMRDDPIVSALAEYLFR